MRHLISPRVEHLQALLLARLVAHRWWHVAFLAPWRIPCPLLRQRQAEIEQGMVVARDVAQEHTDLAVVDLSSMAAPLALDAHRMRAALGKTAGIKGDDPIGFTQPLDHLFD